MSSDELRSWVVALHAPRAVHKFRLKAWAGFLRERGCVVVVPAKDLRRRATHVLLVDPPCAEEDDPRFAAYLASMPASCVAGAGGGTPPTILRQEWMYDSIRQKRALPTGPYALGSAATRTPLADVQPAPRASNPRTRAHPNDDDASAKPPAVPPAPTRGDDGWGGEILRAANDARDETRRLTFAAAGEPGQGVGGVEAGTLRGCLAAECDAAASSAASHAPWEGASTRGDFARFRREGYPGFVGATNVVEDEIERRLGARWDAREAERVAGEDAAWAAAAAAKAGTRARARAGVGSGPEESSRPGGFGRRTLLLDLPDGVLGEVMERLCLRDALNAGATCRRLLDVAFGRRVRRRRQRRRREGGIGHENAGDGDDDAEFVLGGSARDPPPWPDRSGGVRQHACLRVMTWNLKNNDPDPAARFANQPGANERGGGWHWHVRCPIVARSVQRDAPHVLCLQEDLGCMASELMCAREMREEGYDATEYRCYPPPVRSLRDADAAARARRVLLSPSETDPLCAGDAIDETIANALREGARWEQNSVWWRDDAFEAMDAGQFEWLDGRTRARFRGLSVLGTVPGTVPRSEHGGVPGSVVTFTWVLLRLKGDERGCGMAKGVTRSIDKRIVACSTHVEAGHDWNDDVPAKRNSAICVRACVRRIQDLHGRDVPIVVGGDFNMQKIQQHYRLLTGAGAGISRGLSNVSGNLSSGTANRATGKGGGGGGGGGGSPADAPDASPPRKQREWDLDEERADRASELVDVFDCLDADNPIARFDRKHRGVRSGGHAGTTWHGWEGPAHAEMISNTIAKHCKHNAQLGWWDPGELGDGPGDGGFHSFKRRRGWGRDDQPGVGGGHGGAVGGARGGGSTARVLGAVGHQRHIDHVFVARGDGVRDDTRADVQCRARCVRAYVRVDTNSETFRRRGESRCACGAYAVGGPMSETCACHDVDGVWASDHFPVVADLRLSWSADEGEPVRRFRSRRPHTP